MRHLMKRPSRLPLANRRTSIGPLLLAVLVLALPPTARAGQLAWLDEVVQQVVREAKVGGRAAVRGGDATATTAHAAGRLIRARGRRGPGALSRGIRTTWPGPAAGSTGPPRPCCRAVRAALAA